MNFLSLSDITNKAQDAFRRFPITLLWAITGTAFSMYLVNHGNRFEEYSGVFLTFILGISWFIGTQFLIEQLNAPKRWAYLKWIVLGLLLVFYWHLPNGAQIENTPEFLIRFFLYLLAGHFFVLFAPFIIKWHKAAYWNYLKSIAIAIGRSILFSGVLFLGLVLALLAIDALFEVNIPGERYGQLFIFCLGIVNTWIYLSDFPSDIHQNTSIYFPRVFEVFVKYILTPLVIVYVIILYTYSFKIVFQWELPKGWVSYLVTALAFLGFIIQVIINPVQKTLKSWTINRFHPWFYILLLPLIVLLFVAIGRRIADYGITEKRYFVLVLAFWILAMTAYILVAKKKRLIMLPISLFTLTLLSSFGFWGAFSVSLNSQVRQFEHVFKEVNAQNKMASSDQFEQLKSIISYLQDRASTSKLDRITGIDMQKTLKDSSNITSVVNNRSNFDPQKVLNELGITINPEDLEQDKLYGTHYTYYVDQNRTYNYDIHNFDYFSPIQFSNHVDKTMEIGEFYVRYSPEQVELHLVNKNSGSNALKIPLRERFLRLSGYGMNLSTLEEQEMTLEVISDSVLAKLVFRELNYAIKKDSIDLIHSKAYLFIKRW